MINMIDIDTIGIALFMFGFPALVAAYALGFTLGRAVSRDNSKKVG